MAKKPVKRIYSISDGTLAELADEIIAYAERDLADMTTYGYDQPRLDAIKVKISDFKIFDSDEIFTGLMMEATQIKNDALFAMTNLAEGVVQRASVEYDNDAAKLKSFGWAGYAAKTDADKMVAVRTVHKQGTNMLAELASQGLTIAILNTLAAAITTTDNAITNKNIAVSNRDIGVSARITLGNDVYKETVNVANTGKNLYEDTDESKYNDYVIYNNRPNTQTVSGTVPPASVHSPSVVIGNIADEFQITVTSGTLTAYFSDDPTDEPAVGQTTVTITADTPYTAPAGALDWSSTNFRLLLKNEHASDAVQFTVIVRG